MAMLCAVNAEELSEGMKLPELKLNNGTIYKNVTVRSITPEGVSIMHEEGTKTVPASQLPPSLKGKTQFLSPEELAKKKAEDERARAAYDQQMDREMAQNKSAKPETTAEAKTDGRWVATGGYTAEFQIYLDGCIASGGSKISKGGASSSQSGFRYTEGRFKGKTPAQLVEAAKAEFAQKTGRSPYAQQWVANGTPPPIAKEKPPEPKKEGAIIHGPKGETYIVTPE